MQSKYSYIVYTSRQTSFLPLCTALNAVLVSLVCIRLILSRLRVTWIQYGLVRSYITQSLI